MEATVQSVDDKNSSSLTGMTKSRSMTKRQNRGDGCSRSGSMTCENSGVAPWSDLDHHLLYLVMMKLEAVDFLPFSEVCKSWRSLALSNKTNFIESRPPMAISISISKRANKKEYWLVDSEGRKYRMPPLPQFGVWTCVGLTCGYLVLYGKKTREFWLVNPITRHVIHFPRIPWRYVNRGEGIRGILVFSPSISAWVFLVLCRRSNRIWFSIAGDGVWDYVYSNFPIRDLHDFKDKIYVIDSDSYLFELGFDPGAKLTLLRTKNFAEAEHRYMPSEFLQLVCSGENLYAIEGFLKKEYEIHELDFCEMKWVSPNEKTMEEHAFFVSDMKHGAVIKRDLLPDCLSRYKKYADSDTGGNHMFFTADLWYFAHDCLKVNSKQE